MIQYKEKETGNIRNRKQIASELKEMQQSCSEFDDYDVERIIKEYYVRADVTEYRPGQKVKHEEFTVELHEYLGDYHWRCWCLCGVCNDYSIIHEDDFRAESEVPKK